MRFQNQILLVIVLSGLFLLFPLNGKTLGRSVGFSQAEPLSTSELMTHKQLIAGTTPGKRCIWYREKLGPYIETIKQAAQKENIPPQLLMTVILNELADIEMKDAIQDQQLASTGGDFKKYKQFKERIDKPAMWWKPIKEQSFGIAQITPKTAIQYNAVSVPGIEKYERSALEFPTEESRNEFRERMEFQVAYALLNRQVAISAAARIIKGLFNEIERNQDYCDWVKQFTIPGRRFSASDPYEAILPDLKKKGIDSRVDRINEREKEKSLSNLLIAAYNSGGILTDSPYKVGSYPNATKHGGNSIQIAEDIYETYACDLGIYKVWDAIKNREESKEVFAPNAIVGRWHWFNNRIIEMRPNGVAIDTTGEYQGRWIWSGGWVYIVTWSQGGRDIWIDTLKLSADWQKLGGQNQNGNPVSATREK